MNQIEKPKTYEQHELGVIRFLLGSLHQLITVQTTATLVSSSSKVCLK